jgi:hypothetical protein
MKGSVQRFLFWLPWIALGILGVLCVWVLAVEASKGVEVAGVVSALIGAVFVFAALAIAIEAVTEEVQVGKMRPWTRRLLFWLPRVVALLFAAFVSLFALDVFGAGYTFWETVLALAMHLLPVGILLVGILIAWRWEWVGTLFLMGWAVWYLAMAWGQFPFSVYLLLAILPFTIGLLFLLNWWYRDELHQKALPAH